MQGEYRGSALLFIHNDLSRWRNRKEEGVMRTYRLLAGGFVAAAIFGAIRGEVPWWIVIILAGILIAIDFAISCRS